MCEVPHHQIGDYPECSPCVTRAVWIALRSNLFLFFFKAVVGLISGSKAVLADSLYSLKDFVASLVVLIGRQLSGRPPDENYPYGHGKVEHIAVFLISILIIGAAVFLFIHSAKDVWNAFHGQIVAPQFIAFWAALISVVANYKLADYLHCVGTRLKSPTMLANARHNHSDAVASTFVAGAILGTQFGLLFLDPLVAVIETVDLARLSAVMAKDSLREMLDVAVSKPERRRIESLVTLVPGVRRVHSLTARSVGQEMWVYVVIKVDRNLALEDGDRVGRQVKETIMKKIAGVAGVNLSIGPHLS